jgi:LysW-gamma-L-lysine carboxypeptidase
MSNEEALGFLENCIRIYSPSGEERAYSLFLSDFLKLNGFKVNLDKVGNLIAEKGKGEPTLLLSSHLDTIPGELPIQKKDGKLYGRGTVDCKSSLAAMVYSVGNFNFDELDTGKIIFAGIVQEERSLLGINELLRSDIEPDYALFGEPTEIDQICIGYKGRLSIGYSVLTKQGHVASAWLYNNAIEILLEIWNSIQKVCNDLNTTIESKSQKTKYFDKIIPNLTVISGGDPDMTNCVPSKASIHVDIRFPPSIKSNEILKHIAEKVNKTLQKHRKDTNVPIKMERTISSRVEGYEIEGNSILTGALRWSIYKTLKRKPKLIKKTGTTFINQIGIHFKVPSITYGPGDPKLEHSDEEYIEISEFLEAIKIYKKFFSKLFELHKRKNKC